TYRDENGLTFPKSITPFDVYLMHVPGKTINTKERAEEIYQQLIGNNVSVLFDDRDERAGVKFNDADLIGSPIRITVGEKALQNRMVELKVRKANEKQDLLIENLLSTLNEIINSL